MKRSFADILQGLDDERAQKLARKLPEWAAAGAEIPSALALEQCSSAATAAYKATLYGGISPEPPSLRVKSTYKVFFLIHQIWSPFGHLLGQTDYMVFIFRIDNIHCFADYRRCAVEILRSYYDIHRCIFLSIDSCPYRCCRFAACRDNLRTSPVPACAVDRSAVLFGASGCRIVFSKHTFLHRFARKINQSIFQALRRAVFLGKDRCNRRLV